MSPLEIIISILCIPYLVLSYKSSRVNHNNINLFLSWITVGILIVILALVYIAISFPE